MGHNVLRQLRRGKGWTHDKAAAELGMSRGGYIKLERGERRLTVALLTKAAAVYEVSQSTLMPGSSTEIAGRVVSGGIVELYPDDDTERVSVQMPPGGAPSAKALLVEGGALPGVAEDHWLIFYEDAQPGMPEDRLGELCVVAVDGGSALKVGRVYRGEHRGRYDVATPGYEPLKGTTIEWCALVTWIKPR